MGALVHSECVFNLAELAANQTGTDDVDDPSLYVVFADVESFGDARVGDVGGDAESAEICEVQKSDLVSELLAVETETGDFARVRRSESGVVCR